MLPTINALKLSSRTAELYKLLQPQHWGGIGRFTLLSVHRLYIQCIVVTVDCLLKSAYLSSAHYFVAFFFFFAYVYLSVLLFGESIFTLHIQL